MDDSRARSLARYLVTYWWVFAALGTIAIVMSSLLYLEQDTGKRLVDWCGVTCTIFGALIGALLIVLTHSYHRKRFTESWTVARLSELEGRVHILEAELDDKAKAASRVVLLGDFKTKSGPKH